MPRQPRLCPECGGKRLYDCPECGKEHDCDRCLGTGLDPAVYDVRAFLAACRARLPRMSWGWHNGGVWLGRRDDDGTVAFEEFRREADADAR